MRRAEDIVQSICGKCIVGCVVETRRSCTVLDAIVICGLSQRLAYIVFRSCAIAMFGPESSVGILSSMIYMRIRLKKPLKHVTSGWFRYHEIHSYATQSLSI
jgi:hypothetical protein